MSGEKKLFNPAVVGKIAEGKKQWEAGIAGGKGVEGDYKTESGIPVKLLYTPEDIAELDYQKDLGYSGQAPYTRGIYPNMYRGRMFTMRQLAGFGGPEDCNERIKFLLDNGATGVNIVLDLPSIRGYNSDDPEAEGNVGICGVAIDSVEDMMALFDGVPIDEVSVSFVTHIPSTTVALLSMYIEMAVRRGIPFPKLAGTSQNDFLMECCIGSAPEIIPPRNAFRLQCDAIEYVTKNLPRWNPVSLNGYNLREAGTDAVQEVAIAISNAKAILQEMNKRGVSVDDVAPRISFFWDLCNDFFEEIAKCRSSRRVYHDLISNYFKAQKERSKLMRFHVQTAGITLTAAEPFNNIVRSAIQGLAAILGGAQSLHVDSYDEAYSAPTEQASLLSLRTQQILQVETGVTNTVDPLGGSYYVEYLTNEMEKRITDYMDQIERKGGLIAVTENGWLHREISDYAYRQQQEIENGTRKIVGVNYMTTEGAIQKVDVFKYPETEQRQRVKLESLRSRRDEKVTQEKLNEVRLKLRTEENIMPYVRAAAAADATLGEIQDVFREVFGLWQFPLA